MAVMTTLELTREDHPRLMLSQDELPFEVRTGTANHKYRLITGNDFWLSVRAGTVTADKATTPTTDNTVRFTTTISKASDTQQQR